MGSLAVEVLQDGMREADFLRPDGMLAWLSSHILEMKVEDQLGAPPKLQDTTSHLA